jgi:hypothetical protein
MHSKSSRLSGIYLSTALLGVLLVSCGQVSTSSDGDKAGEASEADAAENVDKSAALACGASSHDNKVDKVLLSSADLLSKKIVNSFGTDAVMNVTNRKENIVAKYANQFGTTKDLEFGDISSDNFSNSVPATAYLLALSTVARNAGLYCSVADDTNTKCQCNTRESAAAMLNRSISYVNFCADEGNDLYIKALTDLCKKDRVAAITALVSSLAFAIRN